ncbi:uncharacterized protein BX663DRAFT_497111 [Cokeromyces recurvatus]|uniref:uncharacterized protein n=1 Tax=Cokeromyces recurvatus TaxID=90255 RepID=UPI002220F9FF|nr:uncharacterized protein BX663DRAFT_497111 [Cokeromyces recurvatus]KAI7906619.1 hypothetical protein BX663DRAFT_497111 [Cokeromyces recurvatus]
MSDVNTPLLATKDQRPSTSIHPNNEEQEESYVRATDYGTGIYRYPRHLQPTRQFTSLEKFMFFSSSILVILLFLFIDLYARSSQKDDDEPIIRPPAPTHDIPKNHTKISYCLDSSCIVTAAQILQDVDRELDPCNDFYAYACNQWKENHALSDDKSRLDRQEITTESIYHRLEQILKREWMDESTSLPNPEDILNKQLFTKLKDLYQSCINQEPIVIEPLYALFRDIQSFIPLSKPQLDRESLNKAIHYLADLNIWPLFRIKMKSDVFTNTRRPILSLEVPYLTLPYRALYDDPSTMSVYTQLIVTILDAVFKHDVSNEFGWKAWSTIATARRIVEFEKTIVKALVLEKNEEQESKKWRIEELEGEVSSIDWRELLRGHKGTVLVPSIPFMKHLKRDVLSVTNSRTIHMYFIWRIIWYHLDRLGDQLSILKTPMYTKLTGVQRTAGSERQYSCMKWIHQSDMGLLMGHYYALDQQERIEKAKRQVEVMSQDIVRIFKERIPHLPWIPHNDNLTKQAILNKLENIEFQIDYSQASVISLVEYFSDIKIEKNDFFRNMLRTDMHKMKQIWRLLDDDLPPPLIHKDVWNKINTQFTRVYYDRELNKVTVPGSLLQLPYFDPNGPLYLYMGTLGWMIGHEIMHGFDNIGRHYNDKGQFGQHWWTDESVNSLEQETQCLIRQFDDYGLNGQLIVDNNFADLGGLKVIEYMNITNKMDLPGLEHWNKEQIAYIQFARLKCSKTRKEREEMLDNNKHAPDRYRVNGPLINSKHFSNTFQCKSGSYMNPAETASKKKCQVW